MEHKMLLINQKTFLMEQKHFANKICPNSNKICYKKEQKMEIAPNQTKSHDFKVTFSWSYGKILI